MINTEAFRMLGHALAIMTRKPAPRLKITFSKRTQILLETPTFTMRIHAQRCFYYGKWWSDASSLANARSYLADWKIEHLQQLMLCLEFLFPIAKSRVTITLTPTETMVVYQSKPFAIVDKAGVRIFRALEGYGQVAYINEAAENFEVLVETLASLHS